MHKQKIEFSRLAVGLLMGTLAFLIISLTILAAGSMLVLKQTMNLEQGQYCVALSLMIGSFAGGLTAVSIVGKTALPVSMASGGMFFALLLMMKLSFFNGQFSNVFLTILLVVGGSVAAGFVKIRKGGSEHFAHKRRIRKR